MDGINYFGIENCVLTEYEKKPVLRAPASAPTDALTAHGFVQMPDGNWYHFLTDLEYQTIHDSPDSFLSDFEIPEDIDERRWKGLFLASLALVVLGIIGLVNGVLGVTSVVFFLPLIGLLVFFRIRYPKIRFYRILSIIGIIFIALSIALTLFLIFCCGITLG